MIDPTEELLRRCAQAFLRPSHSPQSSQKPTLEETTFIHLELTVDSETEIVDNKQQLLFALILLPRRLFGARREHLHPTWQAAPLWHRPLKH